MAYPLRTDDIPEFDTYPGPESPETAEARPSLHSAAEQIGAQVGRAVRAARHLPDQARASLRRRMNVIHGGPRAAAEKAAALKDAARQKLAEGKQRAAQLTRQARERAGRIADEQPLHVLLGVLTLGVVAGVALRLWRDRD